MLARGKILVSKFLFYRKLDSLDRTTFSFIIFALLVLLLTPLNCLHSQTLQSNLDSIPFAPAVDYWAGGRDPASVFCADLDGDGDLDLAVANADDDNVSIFKNNGDGTFQNAVNYPAGDAPYSIFCADLDGDGDLDLVTANYNGNNVSILKNNGDGTFQSPVNYNVGVRPRFVSGGDLDGDTDMDLVIANAFDVKGSILKNNGDGTFQSAVNYPGGSGPWSVICADLDGDTDMDLAVANAYGDNVSILKNDGDGTFPTKVDYGVGDTPFHIFCADLDGDTDLDLAVSNEVSDDVSILKNNGDGTFQPAANYGAENEAVSTFCADLDGDTDLDLAVANLSSTNVSILKNNGNGTFQNAINYGTGHANYYVFCADLDGDGDLDLAVAKKYADKLSILKNLTQVPANQAPWAFSLISPSDEDTVLNPVTFRWQAPYDPNFGDQIRYDLYLSTAPGFDPDSTVVYDSLPLAKFTDTLDNDTYYWKVKAYDNWGAERWSTQSWSFYVNSRLSSYSLLYPLDNDTIESPVALTWQGAIDLDNDTVTYNLYLSRSTLFNPDSTETIVELLDTTYTDSLDFGLWYWKVKAYDKLGEGRWSDQVWSFFVNSNPAPYSLLTPQDDDSVKTPVNLEWQVSVDTDTDDTVRYDLCLSRSPVFNPDSIIAYDSLIDTTFIDSLDIKLWYWKVKAYDNWGAIRWSDQTWSFYVYLCGDCNGDGQLTILDVIYEINYLFKGGIAPKPLIAGDLSCDAKETVLDVVYMINYLFKNGDTPCKDCP